MCHICIDICGFSLICADFICIIAFVPDYVPMNLWFTSGEICIVAFCWILCQCMYIVHLYTLIYILLIYMYFAGPDYVLCRKICSLIGSLDADQEGFDQMPLLHHFDITAKMYLSQIDKHICLKLHNVFVSNCKTAD